MRALVISIVAVVLLICIWFVFFDYSGDLIHSYINEIEDEIIPAIESGEWDKSYQLMKDLNKEWHKFKKVAILFLDTETINEIDYTLAKSVKYVKCKDDSNSTGELNSMIEQLTFLHKNDEMNVGNIL